MIARYLRPDAPQLRQRDDGFCVFFSDGGGCGVHADRPPVCRLYPLGRVVDWEGGERYRSIDPHPETEGGSGIDGRVADSGLVRDMLTVLAGADAPSVGDVQQMDASGDEPAAGAIDLAWLDIDAAVQAHCAATGGPVPGDVEAEMVLHIAFLRSMLDDDGG